ncbi:MAG: 50S ribosomal protein L15 [Pseudanabaenaceae cyanobacterium bins.68]|nr:50S ribosomal protein L15 [Pseudanabaenaceae cyanobacterium bins.68]
MRIDDLQPQAGAKHRKRRVGRGIAAGQGASCGFGMRGQNSRSGRPTRAGFEGGQNPLYRRTPKLKHFPVVYPKRFTLINVESLANLPSGSEVTLDSLLSLGILTQNNGELRVLGRGDLQVGLTVYAHSFTSGAKTKIETAGGTCVATGSKMPEDV